MVLATQHYQFKAIHPFADGNGGTGRILNVLLLIESGLLHEPVLYLSRYIIQRKSEYYRRLLEVTSARAWEPWILFLLEGVRRTAEDTLAKIDRIQALQETVREEMKTRTSASSNSDLLDVLFEQPYCRIANVVERCSVSRPTATKWLKELVQSGTLVDQKIGRERLFINQRFLRILAEAVEDGVSDAEPTLF